MTARRRPPSKPSATRVVAALGSLSRDASYGPAPRLAGLRRWVAFLERGHRGPAVCFVQEVLNLVLGDDDRRPLRIDGHFGSETSAAVRAFQQGRGLPPNGQVPTEILLLLQREAIRRFEAILSRWSAEGSA